MIQIDRQPVIISQRTSPHKRRARCYPSSAARKLGHQREVREHRKTLAWLAVKKKGILFAGCRVAHQQP